MTVHVFSKQAKLLLPMRELLRCWGLQMQKLHVNYFSLSSTRKRSRPRGWKKSGWGHGQLASGSILRGPALGLGNDGHLRIGDGKKGWREISPQSCNEIRFSFLRNLSFFHDKTRSLYPPLSSFIPTYLLSIYVQRLLVIL